jgi:adenylate cyclase class 1
MTDNIKKYLDLISKNHQYFLDFNRQKKDNFFEDIKKSALNDYVTVLPYLISHNRPSLPGFIEDLTMEPGISEYVPDNKTLNVLRNKFKLIVKEEEQKLETDPFIRTFAIMGSISTVAYNKGSDFDFWICYYESDISSEDLSKYKQKLDKLSEVFLKQFKIPVHFYLNEVDKLKQNIFSEEDGGGFTTTAGALLKDEFYRSSIILAGKIPFWWIVPPGLSDEKYQMLVTTAKDNDAFSPFVNTGNLKVDNREDFLGATFFQILKSLESPFKSILKIGLLEKYLIAPDKNNMLLSDNLKQKLQKGSITSDILDSYRFLFNTVYDFFVAQNAPAELVTLLQKSFYIKASPALSKRSMGQDRKTRVFKEIITEWGWSATIVSKLDDFDSWELGEIKALWDQLKKYIIYTYQNIKAVLPEMNLSSTVSKDDFVIISRKIESFFGQSQGKIKKWIPFKDQVFENILYFSPIDNSTEGLSKWSAGKTVVNEKRVHREVTLNQEKTLLELLIWAVTNSIYSPLFTQIKVKPNYRRIDTGDAKKFLDYFSKTIHSRGTTPKNNFMLKKAFIIRAFITFNFHHPGESGVKEICFIYKTSWNETFIHYFSTVKDILRIVELFIKLRNKDYPLPEQCFSYYVPEGAGKSFQYFAQMMTRIVSYFSVSEKERIRVFLFSFNNMFVLIDPQSEKILTYYRNLEGALYYAANIYRNKQILVGTSDKDSALGSLSSALSSADASEHQLYYYSTEKHTMIYFILKSGQVYYFPVKTENAIDFMKVLLHSMYKVFENDLLEKDFKHLFTYIQMYRINKQIADQYDVQPMDFGLVKQLDKPGAFDFNTYKIQIKKEMNAGFEYYYHTPWGQEGPASPDKSLDVFKKIYKNYLSSNIISPFPAAIEPEGNVNLNHVSVFNFYQYLFNLYRALGIKLFKNEY